MCSCARWSLTRREAAAGIARQIRDAGTRTILDVADRRLDRKLRGAGRIGARVAVIIGENEVAADSAVVRDLDGHSQQTVPIAELAATVTRILGGDYVSTDRTYCGTPRAADAGTQATVFGWVDRRRDHGGLIFIDLRDHTGILQVVIDPNDAPEAHRAAREARLEWVLRFDGEIRMRAPENVNPKRETGEVELRAGACTVLAVARTPPFPVNEDTEVDEQLRLRHRYLDLRRVHLQRNLRARAKFCTELRTRDGARSDSWRSRRR